MTGRDTNIGDGGAKDREAKSEPEPEVPVSHEENRQALKNQSSVKPEQYPDRGKSPV